MTNFNWTCPHCHHPQIVTDRNYDETEWFIQVGEVAEGKVGLRGVAVGCLNEECKKLTLNASLVNVLSSTRGDRLSREVHRNWTMLPDSSAKPQPDFIPEPLRADYLEACRIRDLSPKASATLARRCLQGMIRDFCKISKRTLDEEIKELRARVDGEKAPRGVTHESVDAIDHVRSVGNIGAHMERDIDLIIDIEPGEAQLLIELIETLFDEWYVARDKRAKRFETIKALSEEKRAAKEKPPGARE